MRFTRRSIGVFAHEIARLTSRRTGDTIDLSDTILFPNFVRQEVFLQKAVEKE